MGKGATSEAGKSLFRPASVWWRCAKYFYGTLHITHKLNFLSNLCSWNPYGTVCVFLTGPFILLINWTLVKSVFMKSSWDRVCISYGTLLLLINWTLVKSVYTKSLWNRQGISYGTFLLLINWTLVKSVFMKSLWDRVCISYGTHPMTHKLNFGQICVHKILMEPSGYFLWDPSYYS